MNSRYGSVVFDEWAVVSLVENKARVLFYTGPRNDEFLKNFVKDLGALRAELARPDPRRRIMPGVRELLDALSSRPDVLLGLLTGNIEEGARAKLEPFGLNGYFPSGGFSSDHRDRSEIARLAHEKTSRHAGAVIPPGRVSVLGDTEHDISCARANGFRAIAVYSGWVPHDRLAAAHPDFLFEDLSDLPSVLSALGLPA